MGLAGQQGAEAVHVQWHSDAKVSFGHGVGGQHRVLRI